MRRTSPGSNPSWVSSSADNGSSCASQGIYVSHNRSRTSSLSEMPTECRSSVPFGCGTLMMTFQPAACSIDARLPCGSPQDMLPFQRSRISVASATSGVGPATAAGRALRIFEFFQHRFLCLIVLQRLLSDMCPWSSHTGRLQRASGAMCIVFAKVLSFHNSKSACSSSGSPKRLHRMMRNADDAHPQARDT